MALSFVRVDDRVIHGQLVTRWSSEFKCDGIIGIDDKVANDPVLSGVMRGAAPVGTKVWIFDVKTAAEKLEKIIASDKKYFIITRTPITLKRIIEKGFSLNNFNGNKINVGPMSAKDTTVTVAPNACVLKEEAEAFNFLESKGNKIEFQLVPDSKVINWKDIKGKFFTE